MASVSPETSTKPTLPTLIRPSPSWPNSSLPQQTTVPDSRSTQVCDAPPVTCTASSQPDATQEKPHSTAHAPQLSGSREGSTSQPSATAPLQSSRPSAHASRRHTPAMHELEA